MTQERWEELKKKYASLDVISDREKIVNVRCLMCSKVLVKGDSKLYCYFCLVKYDAETLEKLMELEKHIRAFDEMVLMGILTHDERGYSPNCEFMEYLKECMNRNYETIEIPKDVGLRLLRSLTMMQDRG